MNTESFPRLLLNKLIDAVDDNELRSIVEHRLSAPFTSVKVELDDLDDL